MQLGKCALLIALAQSSAASAGEYDGRMHALFKNKFSILLSSWIAQRKVIHSVMPG
jgi:hypothetical protein